MNIEVSMLGAGSPSPWYPWCSLRSEPLHALHRQPGHWAMPCTDCIFWVGGGEDEFTQSAAFVRYHPNYEETPAKTTLKSLTLAQGGFGVKDHEDLFSTDLFLLRKISVSRNIKCQCTCRVLRI